MLSKWIILLIKAVLSEFLCVSHEHWGILAKTSSIIILFNPLERIYLQVIYRLRNVFQTKGFDK